MPFDVRGHLIAVLLRRKFGGAKHRAQRSSEQSTFPLYIEVDQIYNLACPASPIRYRHDPVQTTKTSVHGAINMLGLAKHLRAEDPPGINLGSLWRSERPGLGVSNSLIQLPARYGVRVPLLGSSRCSTL